MSNDVNCINPAPNLIASWWCKKSCSFFRWIDTTWSYWIHLRIQDQRIKTDLLFFKFFLHLCYFFRTGVCCYSLTVLYSVVESFPECDSNCLLFSIRLSIPLTRRTVLISFRLLPSHPAGDIMALAKPPWWGRSLDSVRVTSVAAVPPIEPVIRCPIALRVNTRHYWERSNRLEPFLHTRTRAHTIYTHKNITL